MPCQILATFCLFLVNVRINVMQICTGMKKCLQADLNLQS